MQSDSSVYENRPKLYINRRTPIVTYILAAASVLAFLLDAGSQFIFGAPVLTIYGAKVNAAIILGRQWWRFITPMFLHSGITHILFNMFALVIWGRQLEALLGRARYAAVYFFAGILGCAASFAFSPAVSVGASGAIFGLFGALLYFRKQNKEIFNAVFGMQVLVIIGVNIANGFLVPNIDNFGHIGGIIGGFLACWATGFYGQKQSAAVRFGGAAICALLLALLIAIGYR